jgi:hypothetical protein
MVAIMAGLLPINRIRDHAAHCVPMIGGNMVANCLTSFCCLST